MPTTTSILRDDETPKKSSKPTTTANAKELKALREEVAALKGELASVKRNPGGSTAEQDPATVNLLRQLACLVLAKGLNLHQPEKTLFRDYEEFLNGGPL